MGTIPVGANGLTTISGTTLVQLVADYNASMTAMDSALGTFNAKITDGDSSTLSSAKTYADDVGAQILDAAGTYTDQQTGVSKTEAISAAKTYTDGQVGADRGRLAAIESKNTQQDSRLTAAEAALPYKGLWAGGGDMNEWRQTMRGSWEVRDSATHARPANFPPDVAATVTSVVTVDVTAGGHTVQTVMPTGNGQSLWFRVSNIYTGTGASAWSGWRRADSPLRPRMADGTNLDTLRLQAHEGGYSITVAQALTLTGLPEAGAFGTLHVLASLDGLASQFFHQLSSGGGVTRLWWRMVNHATAFTWGGWQLLTPTEAQAPLRVPVILTTGGGPSSTTTQQNIHARLPFNIQAKANKWRVHFRNYNYRDAQAYAGVLSFAGVGFGLASTNTGRPNGQFSGSVSQIMGATSSPSNAAVFSTPWVTENPIEPGMDYLLSYAYTGAAGQTSYLGVGGGWLSSDTAALLTTDATLVQQKYMPLDVFLEVEVDGRTQVFAYYGDSLTAGVSADLPVYDSYPNRHARANNALAIIYAASGSAMNLWTNPASGQIARWNGYTKPSRLYWSMGSNDVFQPVDIATLRARFNNAWPVITGATTRNVILTTILPRLNAAAGAEAVRKEWNNILVDELPGNALMCIDAAAALTDSSGGVLAERWRGSPTDIHLSKQGYARFAAQL